MTGQNDDGHGYATRVQFLLDFQAIHLGHADIKQDTTLLGLLEFLEKFHAGNPRRHRKTRFLQHETSRAADRVLVIDYVNNTLFIHPASDRKSTRLNSSH